MTRSKNSKETTVFAEMGEMDPDVELAEDPEAEFPEEEEGDESEEEGADA